MTQPSQPGPRLSNAQHRALRTMPGAVNYLARIAKRALDKTGKGHLYEVIVAGGPQRGRVYIKPKGVEGMVDDAENSTLMKLQASLRGAK